MPRPRGRKPGHWTEVNPEQIRAFRQEHDVSRVRLALALGVSASTVQTWETGGGVAAPHLQKRIAEVLARGPDQLVPVPGPAWQPVVNVTAVGPDTGPQVQATGMIVDGYLRACGRKLTPEELLELIRSVRSALHVQEAPGRHPPPG